jgi:hypothetical protein
MAVGEGVRASIRIEEMAVDRTNKKCRRTSAEDEVFSRENDAKADRSWSTGR